MRIEMRVEMHSGICVTHDGIEIRVRRRNFPPSDWYDHSAGLVGSNG